MAELVSILIPAYNAEKWIKATIESALNQTWQRMEIIVVDDGSTDSTLSIASRYESNSFKVASQSNSGASAARNKALSIAQGDYIQWLDSDDLLAPDKISLQLKEHNYGRNSMILLSSAFGFFYMRQDKAKFNETRLWRDLLPVEWLTIRLTDSVWMNPAAWLVSRRLTEKAGLWNENLSYNDDGEYFARVIAASDLVQFVPQAKSYYRQINYNSLSNVITHRACKSFFLSMKLSYDYLLALEDSPRTRAAILKHLQTCLIYFYPDELEILEKINELAKELGGKLSIPTLSYKYSVIRKIFGWKATRRMFFTIPRIKRIIRGNYDRMMYAFDRKMQATTST